MGTLEGGSWGHRLTALLCYCLLLTAGAVGVVEQEQEYKALEVIGYHEGTRRLISCGDKGVWVGLEAQFIHEAYKFAEPTITSLRVLCSSGVVDVQWMGPKPDNFTFGNLHNTTFITKTAKCPDNLGIGGLRWRKAKIVRDEGAEWRLSGMALLCNRPDNAPAQSDVLDTKADAKLPLEFSCKKAKPQASNPRITNFYLWYTVKSWTGLEPVECE